MAEPEPRGRGINRTKPYTSKRVSHMFFVEERPDGNNAFIPLGFWGPERIFQSIEISCQDDERYKQPTAKAIPILRTAVNLLSEELPLEFLAFDPGKDYDRSGDLSFENRLSYAIDPRTRRVVPLTVVCGPNMPFYKGLEQIQKMIGLFFYNQLMSNGIYPLEVIIRPQDLSAQTLAQLAITKGGGCADLSQDILDQIAKPGSF